MTVHESILLFQVCYLILISHFQIRTKPWIFSSYRFHFLILFHFSASVQKVMGHVFMYISSLCASHTLLCDYAYMDSFIGCNLFAIFKKCLEILACTISKMSRLCFDLITVILVMGCVGNKNDPFDIQTQFI
jgi:hypothetical protein